MQASRVLLAAVCVLFMAHAAFGQKGTYVPANIVQDWKACPVKKPTDWDPKVFDSSLDALATLTDLTKDLSKACQTSLTSLSNCALDNDPMADPPSTVTSLSTSDGCCLEDCATSIKQAVDEGCFDSLLKVICTDPKAAKFKVGLFNAGARCANFNANCTVVSAANTTAVGNLTAKATAKVNETVSKATAKVNETLTNATSAAAGAVTSAVQKATGGAAAAAVSAGALVLGALAFLAL